jgi:hypothetical protein
MKPEGMGLGQRNEATCAIDAGGFSTSSCSIFLHVSQWLGSIGHENYFNIKPVLPQNKTLPKG